jgi:hypothetical protein
MGVDFLKSITTRRADVRRIDATGAIFSADMTYSHELFREGTPSEQVFLPNVIAITVCRDPRT